MNPETTSGWMSTWRERVWPRWMSRDIRLVLLARLTMSAFRALASIVVPIYLIQIGFSATELGLLFVVVAIFSVVLSSLVGIFSDHIGRTPFLIALPLLAGLAALVFAFTRDLPLLFFFAGLGSFGRGTGAGAGMIGPYQPAEQALLADAAPPQRRNTIFGLVGFASSLGALIGGPLAALPELLPRLSPDATILLGYQITFLVMAALGVISGLIVIPITETRPTRTPRAAAIETPRARWNPLRELSPSTWPILLRLWMTNSVNGLAIGFFGPFITYWFNVRYGAGPATVGVLYTIINLAALASNLYAPRLAARLGLVRAIFWGRLFQAILMVPMALAPNLWIAGIFYLLRMQAQRIAMPLRQSYVMAVVPAKERGSVGALSNLPMQATSAVSPGIAGYIFANVSLSLPFEIGAALQGLNAILFYFFFHNMRPPEERGVAASASPTTISAAVGGEQAAQSEAAAR